ncbi:MAG: LysR family transcriptional regulator [Pseudomonadota bacterium]|nr:LysR family transcriptional regulator [Pseudomonadota bacterium]
MLDLRGIETFFWVARLGGFRAAADKLHTSQPAVSQRIQLMEERLGVRVFERDTRGVRLTAHGRVLLDHAERMLQLRRDMLQVARAEIGLRGHLSLGVAETLVHTWLPDLLHRVHDRHPELVLQIEVDTSRNLRAQLLGGQVDLALLMGPVSDPSVENLPLGRYPLAWVASASLAQELGEGPLPLERLAQRPVITYSSASIPYQVVRASLMQAARAAGLGLPRMYGSTSLSTILRMVCSDIGVGVVTPAALRRELTQGGLRLLQVASAPLPDLSFSAAWQHHGDSHAPAAVAQMAVEIAALDHELINKTDQPPLLDTIGQTEAC